jgi:hypothetical protein
VDVTAVPIDVGEARARVEAVSDRVASLLRSGIDGDADVPKLTWTASECAAHLVTATRGMTNTAGGAPAPEATAGGIAAVNDERVAGLDERDPSRLAELLVEECRSFLDEVGRRPTGQPVRWYQREIAFDVAHLTCLLVGELVVHGLDIARSAGRPWPIRRPDALLAMSGVLPLLPAYVDRERSAGLDARYGLRLRSGLRVGLAFADGELTIEAPPAGPIDCHLSVDPTTYLLVSYGRQSQWSGILTGRIVAWGRRPLARHAARRPVRGPLNEPTASRQARRRQLSDRRGEGPEVTAAGAGCP